MPKNILLLVKSHFKPELEALGHQVKALAYKGEFNLSGAVGWSMEGCDGVFEDQASISEILHQIQPFRPDCVIYFDDSCPYLRVNQLDKSPVPTIFYSVDSHIHSSWHSYVSGLFDHTFVAQSSYLPLFRAHSMNVSWLPLWAPEIIQPVAHKEIPVCFRGSLTGPQRQQRVDFLKQVAESVPLDFAQGEFREAFPRAEIVLNEQIRDDVNFRVFEAIMCGACLVTPTSLNGLDQLFTPGEHLVTYQPHNAQDAIEKVKGLLADPARREVVARAGREHLLVRHLAEHRAQEVSQVVRTLSISRSMQAVQMALFNMARWWGVRTGRFDKAPELLIRHLLAGLDEVVSSKAELTEQTVFICLELAAASWHGEDGKRLYSLLGELSERGDQYSGAIRLAALRVRAVLDGNASAILPEFCTLLDNLLKLSPFRIFDRPAEEPLVER